MPPNFDGGNVSDMAEQGTLGCARCEVKQHAFERNKVQKWDYTCVRCYWCYEREHRATGARPVTMPCSGALGSHENGHWRKGMTGKTTWGVVGSYHDRDGAIRSTGGGRRRGNSADDRALPTRKKMMEARQTWHSRHEAVYVDDVGMAAESLDTIAEAGDDVGAMAVHSRPLGCSRGRRLWWLSSPGGRGGKRVLGKP